MTPADAAAPPAAPRAAADAAGCVPADVAESLRLAALHRTGLLDSPREGPFDDITRLAALVCGAPIALVSLVDRDRQWFKSTVGLDAAETPIGQSVCAHAIRQDDVFVVEDTRLDARFRDNPLVTGPPGMRFYAGAPMRTADGLALGTVCVIDTVPRTIDAAQRGALRALARQAMAQVELRAALADARASDDYRARRLAIAGHDLRTPLRTAQYAISKLQRDAAAPVATPLADARQALALVAARLDELAAMAAVGAGRAAPDLTAVPLAEVFDVLDAVWRPAAARRGLSLRLRPTTLAVRSHPTLLSTLLGNLVGNAVKYTEAGGVLVGCRRRGDAVVVEVVDTGIGIAPDALSGLFEAFRQADPRSDGLGMGLWIVQRTAASIGVAIAVDSRPGRGTRFRVTLPLA